MASNLSDLIASITAGLDFISETDAPISAVELGRLEDLSESGTAEATAAEGEGEEVAFDDWFAPLIAVREGDQELQRSRAKKFLELKTLLEENLRDLTVYKFGSVRKKIFVLGRNSDGRVQGIATESVET